MAQADNIYIMTIEGGYNVEDVAKEINQQYREGRSFIVHHATARILSSDSILVTTSDDRAAWHVSEVGGIGSWGPYDEFEQRMRPDVATKVFDVLEIPEEKRPAKPLIRANPPLQPH